MVSSENPPKFSFIGSGKIIVFGVSVPFTKNELAFIPLKEISTEDELNKNRKALGGDRLLWEIEINPEHSVSVASAMQPITYGIVPKGYHQRFPPGRNPVLLQEGYYYTAGAPTINAGEKRLVFKIEQGQVIPVSEEFVTKQVR